MSLNEGVRMKVKLKKISLVSILVISLTISIYNRPLTAIASGSAIIRVPQDYKTIQEAISNADPGDIICVYSGNYSGSIVIDKTDLKIIGENKSTTIINLDGGNSIEITAHNTSIEGFTIQRASQAIIIESDNNSIYDNIFEYNYEGIYCGFSSGYPKVSNNLMSGNEFYNSGLCGIYLFSACKNNISNNRFSDNNWGICLFSGSSNNVLDGNTIMNSRGLGIVLNNCTHNIVSNNHIDSAGTTGIYVDQGSNYNIVHGNVLTNTNGIWGILYVINSYYNTVTNNVLMNNSGGIYLDHTFYTIIGNNTMIGNRYGLGVNGDSLSHFVHSIDNSNKINGKPVYYLVNQEKITLDAINYSELGFLGIINSTNVKIRDLQVTNNWHGLLLAYTTNSTVENVTVSNNNCGMYLINSPNNTLIYNTFSKNSYGICLMNSESTVYKNNFSNNTQQVICPTYNPFWNNGAEGNFWSDYTGEDQNGDGIGDSPYAINEDNQDQFPLIDPVSFRRVFYAGTWDQIPYYVIVYSNSTVAGFNFNSALKQITFNVSGSSGKTGFCNVSIPKNLLNGDYEIWIGNTTVIPSLVSNGTYSFLYFTYNCTTRNVRITGTIAISPLSPISIVLISILLMLFIIIAGKLKTRRVHVKIKRQLLDSLISLLPSSSRVLFASNSCY
jgi:parallel beta-helix repeat protein